MTDATAMTAEAVELTSGDLSALGRAVSALEETTVANRLTNLLGQQIAAAGNLVPERLRDAASRGANLALRAAMGAALRSLREGRRHVHSQGDQAGRKQRQRRSVEG